jgi:hypothetical protein
VLWAVTQLSDVNKRAFVPKLSTLASSSLQELFHVCHDKPRKIVTFDFFVGPQREMLFSVLSQPLKIVNTYIRCL